MKKATGKEAWDHLDYELKKRSTYKGLAALANDGDPACAEKMVRLAYFYVGHSKDMPEDIRNYLRRCLGRIIKGTTPNRAFNYEREGKRGAPANFIKEIRDADIAQAVRSVKDQCASLEAAYDKVADTYSGFQDRDNLSGFKNPGAINRGAVKKAYLRYFPDDDSREG